MWKLINAVASATVPNSKGYGNTAAKLYSTGRIFDAEHDLYGGAKLIYAKAMATIPIFHLCKVWSIYNPTAASTLKHEVVCNLLAQSDCSSHYKVVVALQALKSGQYGWFLVEGLCPVASENIFAANSSISVSSANAGHATVLLDGLMLHGIQVSTEYNFMYKWYNNCSFRAVDTIYSPNGTDGMFTGMVVTDKWPTSGNGAVIKAISEDDRLITLTAAADFYQGSTFNLYGSYVMAGGTPMGFASGGYNLMRVFGGTTKGAG